MLSSVAKFFFNKSTLLIQSKTQCIRYQRSPVSLVQPQSLFNSVREENSLVITPKMRWPSQQLRRWRTFISLVLTPSFILTFSELLRPLPRYIWKKKNLIYRAMKLTSNGQNICNKYNRKASCFKNIPQGSP